MWYILVLLIGLCIGIIFGRFIYKSKYPKSIGVLNIVESDEDSPYLFVELEESPYQLYSKQIVTMNVEVVHTNSQK